MLDQLNPGLFTWQRWRAGYIADLGVKCRFWHITSSEGKSLLRKYAVGWCYGESLLCRPKENENAIMFYTNDKHFWFHLRRKEFDIVFNKGIK